MSASRDGSEIATIEAHVYSASLGAAIGYSQGWLRAREAAVARLETTDGTVGWGEGYSPARATAAAIELVAGHYLGRSVFERVTLGRRAYARLRDFGQSGILSAALSAVATACCDAAAKQSGLPAWALLGGGKAPAWRPYASGLCFREHGDPTGHYGEAARALTDAGFDAVKLKIGLGIDADLRAVEHVLGAVGDSAAVMVDANHAYGWQEAVALERRLASYPLTWLEEPLDPERPDEYARLRARSSLPIAGGESVCTRYGARRWLEAGASDILQPDLCLAGGPDEVMAISSLAEAWGVKVVPHGFSIGIGFAATLHWASALAGGERTSDPLWIEVDVTENVMRDAMLGESEWFAAGGAALRLPAGPGLGVEPERIADFRVA